MLRKANILVTAASYLSETKKFSPESKLGHKTEPLSMCNHMFADIQPVAIHSQPVFGLRVNYLVWQINYMKLCNLAAKIHVYLGDLWSDPSH